MKNKQVLDINQMRHLKEMGLELKKDTILVWARFMLGKTSISDWEIAYNHSTITDNSQTIPAYTLQDVLNALPEKITHKHKDYLIEIWKRDGEWYIGYLFFDVDDVVHLHDETNKSFIDAAYSLLCWAIDNKFVETNKNE